MASFFLNEFQPVDKIDDIEGHDQKPGIAITPINKHNTMYLRVKKFEINKVIA